jgi:hypothetical protein
VQSGRQPLGDEAAAHPFNGSPAGPQRSDQVLILAALPRRLIGQQENAGMAELASSSLPVETRLSNPTRSSGVSVTRYFSIAGLLVLKDTLRHDL